MSSRDRMQVVSPPVAECLCPDTPGSAQVPVLNSHVDCRALSLSLAPDVRIASEIQETLRDFLCPCVLFDSSPDQTMLTWPLCVWDFDHQKYRNI